MSEAADEVDVVPLGTIACNSPITALLYRHGKLFVGQADKIIKVRFVNVYVDKILSKSNHIIYGLPLFPKLYFPFTSYGICRMSILIKNFIY